MFNDEKIKLDSILKKIVNQFILIEDFEYLTYCFFYKRKIEINLLHFLFFEFISFNKLGISLQTINNEIDKLLILDNEKQFLFQWINKFKKFLNDTSNHFTIIDFEVFLGEEQDASKILNLLKTNQIIEVKNDLFFNLVKLDFENFFISDETYYSSISDFMNAKTQKNNICFQLLNNFLNGMSINEITKKYFYLDEQLIHFFFEIFYDANINCYENKFFDYLNVFIPNQSFWKPNKLLSIESITYLKNKINKNLLNLKRPDNELTFFKNQFPNDFDKMKS